MISRHTRDGFCAFSAHSQRKHRGYFADQLDLVAIALDYRGKNDPIDRAASTLKGLLATGI
jgi:hypothetical protein